MIPGPAVSLLTWLDLADRSCRVCKPLSQMNWSHCPIEGSWGTMAAPKAGIPEYGRMAQCKSSFWPRRFPLKTDVLGLRTAMLREGVLQLRYP